MVNIGTVSTKGEQLEGVLTMLDFAKDLKIEMKNHEEKTWKITTLENFLKSVEITRNIILETEDSNNPSHNADDYTEDKALWSIRVGRTIDTPILLFRLAEGEECPKCGAKFQETAGALSRRDNRTKICSDCGTREALEDLNNYSIR